MIVDSSLYKVSHTDLVIHENICLHVHPCIYVCVFVRMCVCVRGYVLFLYEWVSMWMRIYI